VGKWRTWSNTGKALWQAQDVIARTALALHDGGRRKMEKSLMLLPFVHGIDKAAFSCALAFAREANATLLLLCLIRRSSKSKEHGVRAEAIAQANDFFVLMEHKAARAGVTTKHIQLSTQHVAASIQALAQEMACTGILLFVREGTGVLLDTNDIKQLLERLDQPLYLFRLERRRNLFLRAGTSLVRCFRRLLQSIFFFSLEALTRKISSSSAYRGFSDPDGI
jgi:hypothetical protein